MRLIPAFRCTWLPGVILLLAAATGWAQAGNVSTAARQDLTDRDRRRPYRARRLICLPSSRASTRTSTPILSSRCRNSGRHALPLIGCASTDTRSPRRSAALAWSGSCATARAQTVLLRADMDALPMKENSGLPYASTKTGKDPSQVWKPRSRTPAGTTCTSPG